jgi:protein TonB
VVSVRRAAASDRCRETTRKNAGVRIAAIWGVTAHRSKPKFPLLTRGLAPSAVAHGVLLAWLAFGATRPGPPIELWEIGLEPLPTRAPEVSVPPSRDVPGATEPNTDVGSGGVALPPGSGVRGAAPGPLPAYAPPAAQAGVVLTAPDDALPSGGAVDFSMVQGTAQRYAGGVTMSRGTSPTAVRDSAARNEGVAGVVGGTPGATGSGGPSEPPRAPPRPVVDKSRVAAPLSKSWSCPFPREADALNLNFARATIAVKVGLDGRALGAVVIADPGNGFGRVARECAMGQRFRAGLDTEGNPRVTTTAPITVTFVR